MEDTKSNDNVLNQRLKNRERQRRYRARKRLESNSTKADTSIAQAQAYILKEEVQQEEAQKQLSQVSVNESRVYCKRKWKKDARIAHLFKQPVFGSRYSTNSPAGSTYESEAPHLLLHLRGESPLGSGLRGNDPSSEAETETNSNVPIRRKWKAEARNKTK